MRIAVLCATRRGVRFVERLAQLAPNAELIIFSFREEPWEPPFFDDLEQLAGSVGARFVAARSVDHPNHAALWKDLEFDLMFVVSWRYMIPAHIYQRTRLGAYLFHDSLLPAYRGFAPTVWAIFNGELQTGVTLLELSEEIDAGPIVDQRAVAIGPDEGVGNVVERVTATYLELLERWLGSLCEGTAASTPQGQSQATFTCRIQPEDVCLDWSAPTAQLHNRIRGYTTPYPGAYTWLEGERLRVWSATPLETRRYVGRLPGKVVEVRAGQGIVVLTGDGELLLTSVEAEGAEPKPATEAICKIGATLGRP